MCDESVNFSTLLTRVLKRIYVHSRLKRVEQESPQVNYAIS